MSDQEIIDAYLAAYKAAHGHCGVALVKEGGWYYLTHSSGTRRPYRGKQIQQMTQTLSRRAAERLA